MTRERDRVHVPHPLAQHSCDVISLDGVSRPSGVHANVVAFARVREEAEVQFTVGSACSGPFADRASLSYLCIKLVAGPMSVVVLHVWTGSSLEQHLHRFHMTVGRGVMQCCTFPLSTENDPRGTDQRRMDGALPTLPKDATVLRSARKWIFDPTILDLIRS